MFASRGKIRFGCFSFDEGTHENNKSRSNSKEYYPYKQDFLHTANIAKRVGSKGGLGEIKPPTLPISMDTSLSSPPFLGPKNEEEGEEEKEEKRRKKKTREMNPLLIWLLDSPLIAKVGPLLVCKIQFHQLIAHQEHVQRNNATHYQTRNKLKQIKSIQIYKIQITHAM